MMKKLKFVALALIASLCASTFVACSNDDDDDDAEKMAVLYYISKNNIPAAAAFDIKTNDTSNALGAALAKLGKGEVLPSRVYDNIKVGVYEQSVLFFKSSYGTEKSVVRADDDTVYLALKAETTYSKEGYFGYSDGGCIIFNVKKGAKITITGKAASENKSAFLLWRTVTSSDDDDEVLNSSGASFDYDKFSSETYTSGTDGKFMICNTGATDIIISEIKVEY